MLSTLSTDEHVDGYVENFHYHDYIPPYVLASTPMRSILSRVHAESCVPLCKPNSLGAASIGEQSVAKSRRYENWNASPGSVRKYGSSKRALRDHCHNISVSINLNRFAFARFRSMIPHRRRRRRGMALVAVYQLAPATIYAISKSPSDRSRWWPLRPAWAVPFARAHLSAPPRVLVKGSWSSRQSQRVAAVAGAAER